MQQHFPLTTEAGNHPQHPRAPSTDGRVGVSGSADTTLMVWDANPGFGRGAYVCGVVVAEGMRCSGCWGMPGGLEEPPERSSVPNLPPPCATPARRPAAGRGRQPLPLLPRPRCALFGHRDRVTCVAVRCAAYSLNACLWRWLVCCLLQLALIHPIPFHATYLPLLAPKQPRTALRWASLSAAPHRAPHFSSLRKFILNDTTRTF